MKVRIRSDFRREFYAQVRALNIQFAQWVHKELAADRSVDLTPGVIDYNSYISTLEDRYLRVPGAVLTFGSGDCNQLGLGTEDADKNVPRPRIVPFLRKERVAMVACGGLHNVVCTMEGRVFTWGCNDDGALGRLTKNEEEETCAGEVVMRGEVIRQVAAGDCQSLAVTLSGKVYAWGCHKDKEGKQWQTPLPREGPKTAKRKQETPMVVVSLDRVAEVRCCASANVALRQDGSLWSWGIGESSELGRPACDLKMKVRQADGEYEDVYDFKNIVKDHLTPGPMYAQGTSTPVHQKFGAFKAIGCGAYHALAVTAAGARVFTCGLNNYGQLGTGDTDNREFLTEVTALDGWAVSSVTGGTHHSLALCATGAVLAFGRSDYGQLGSSEVDKGAGGSEPLPRLVDVPKAAGKPVKIASGANHSLCITDACGVYTWGYSDEGALGHGSEGQDVWLPKAIDFAKAGAEVAGMRVVDADGGGSHSAIVGVLQAARRG
ncbi:regulator of chromosome condensation 1/beta-lactamase-inhibitor protein II [Tribonema minus]|uniref:Regulator of chromosome condensation 1/beta-lactamase-inhibitor protein II n=1 Tax=Tribonema minus TaxID=303371 RepID=A0A835YVE8_9STRA|nr:regulator of chromosome condensation 1/beta-lactamase-inhibitor protein II [Tribonema minus]